MISMNVTKSSRSLLALIAAVALCFGLDARAAEEKPLPKELPPFGADKPLPVLDRMGTTKPTDEEITTAKRYQSGLYLLRNQIQGAIASILASNWVNGLPPEALGEFVTKVNAVSVADIQRVGRSLFASGNQTIVVVGDSGKVKGDVGQFGDVADLKP